MQILILAALLAVEMPEQSGAVILQRPLPAPPASAAATPPPKPGLLPPFPQGNPGEWVTPDDYPTAALRQEISGVTRFRLTIGPDGRVTDCAITESSGSAALDATTCAKITLRARFNPAKDADGNPTVGTYTNAVRWVIPQDIQPLPKLGEVVIAFVVGADGKQSQCRVVSSSGEGARANPVGPMPCSDAAFAHAYTDAAGRPVATRVTMKTVTVAREPGADAESGPEVEAYMPDQDTALPPEGTFVSSSIVETSGKNTNCRVVSVSGAMVNQIRRGVMHCSPSIFITPFTDAQGQPVRRQLLVSTTLTIGDPPSRAPVRKPVRRRK